MHPRVKSEGLLVETVMDEVVVYDTTCNQAHALNRAAALVWQHCDGHTSEGTLAEILEDELQVADGSELVGLALGQFERAGLLDEADGPELVARRRYNRREVLRRLGLTAVAAAALVPTVSSITAPSAAYAQSAPTTTNPCTNCPPFQFFYNGACHVCRPCFANVGGVCLPGTPENQFLFPDAGWDPHCDPSTPFQDCS